MHALLMTQGIYFEMIRDCLPRARSGVICRLSLTEPFPFPSGLMGNCPWHMPVPRAVDYYLVKSVRPASHPYRADSGPPVSPIPIGTGGGA